jgi:hypothetical protein
VLGSVAEGGFGDTAPVALLLGLLADGRPLVPLELAPCPAAGGLVMGIVELEDEVVAFDPFVWATAAPAMAMAAATARMVVFTRFLLRCVVWANNRRRTDWFR